MGLMSKVKRRLREKRALRRRAPSSRGRRRVLFISHEATRTGAPLIILNILKHFRTHCDIQCEAVLHNGGCLTDQFNRFSDLPVPSFELPREPSGDLEKKIRRTLSREKNNSPIFAICNSMESRFVAQSISRLGIPLISLVHELPSSYEVEDYQLVYDHSDRVVFPVQAVRDAADSTLPIPPGKDLILPQGLLKPNFGATVRREQAREQIRHEVGIPNDAFVVLGCGTLDLRKGIDHFASIARLYCRENNDTSVHFVWVGEGPRWKHSTWHYVDLDLKQSPAAERVHFIGARANVEPYFVGSDAFLMSSRVDPFPCVIHEAMATGLPVITFAGSGGAEEAIDGGAGFVVPYADYGQAAGVIKMLVTQPEVASGMRARSRDRVESRYQFSDYGDKLIDLCESVLGQRIRQSQSVVKFPNGNRTRFEGEHYSTNIHRPAA